MDDDTAVRRFLCRCLALNRYRPHEAASVPQAIAIIKSVPPDLALIDIAFPKSDGIAVVRFIRSNPATLTIPVILMTGLRAIPTELVASAEALAVSHLFIKGNSLQMLLHTISEALHPHSRAPRLVQRDGMVADLESHQLSIQGEKLKLPGRRFDVMFALLRTEGPITREELFQRIWPDGENPAVVDVTIMRLRRDLKAFPGCAISSSREGYRLVVTDDAAAAPNKV